MVLHPVVQAGQLVQVPARLTHPEERLLAHLHRLALVERDVHEPAPVLRAAHLGEREDDLLLQVLDCELGVQASQEGGVLRGAALAQPEDRLFAGLFRGALVGGVVAQDLRGAGVVDLRQREERLFPELGVRRGAQYGVERSHGPVAAYLRQPEHRLLAHVGVRVVAGDVEQDVLRLATALLGHDEHSLAAQAGGAGVALREDFLEDGERARSIHLQEAVERRDAQVIVIVLARAAPSERTAGVGPWLRMPSDPLGGLRVPLLGQGALHPREKGVTVSQRRGLRVTLLLSDEHAPRAVEVVVLVERERCPIERIAGSGSGRIAAGKVPVQVGGTLIVRAVERLAGGPPERVGRVLLVRLDPPLVRTQGIERIERIERVQSVQGVQGAERRLGLHRWDDDVKRHDRLLQCQRRRDE